MDLSSIQKRLVARQESLRGQRLKYVKCWSAASKCVDDEFKRRLQKSHKHLDEVKASCDLRLQELDKQLQRDIAMVKSLRTLESRKRDVLKMLEVEKRAANPPPILTILPNPGFNMKGEIKLQLTEMRFEGLSELVDGVPHRCFSPGICELIRAYIPTTIKFKGECYVEYKGHVDSAVYCVVELSGDRMATGDSDDGSIHVWDSQSGAKLLELKGCSDAIFTLASVDGDRLLSGGGDCRLHLWNLWTGGCIREFKGHTGNIQSVCVFTDLKGLLRAASGAEDNAVRIWDLETGLCLRVLSGHTGIIRSISVSNDGQWLVSGSGDHTMRVWNVETGECLRALKGHTRRITSVLVLSDQKRRRVVSASWDTTLRIWDMETGECLRILKNHAGIVQSVSAFADGRHVISGSRDHTMRVWNIETGECTLSVDTGSGVWCVCCLKDGRVVSVGQDEKARVWW